MNEKVVLSDEFLLATSTARLVYSMPQDDKKIIKISTRNKFYKNQNTIENIYYKILNKRNIPLDNIVKCYGYVDTNLGKGLVFDKVCDYNGDISKNFYHTIIEKKLSKDTILELFKDIYIYIYISMIFYSLIRLY